MFVSSTLKDLAPEREAVRAAVNGLRFTPVMFELAARPHAPRDVYRAYLTQSDVFVGVYWQAYGWVAPGETASGVEDEYERAAALPKLVYLKSPAPDRDPRLEQLLARIRDDDHASYKSFSTPEQLRRLVEDDIALLLSERFDATRSRDHSGEAMTAPRPLPVPPTAIIGRAQEVDTVARLMLRERARLVTLTGPGGVGKSRLALEVAARLAPSFNDGVVLSELASVAAPDDVAGAVAAALGARRPRGQSAVEDLRAHVRNRRMLLVIDNFEHVTDAAPLITEMLSAAPGLSVIATSRAPLRLSGEHELSVPPLSLPPASSADVAHLQEYDAVRLFSERARAADLRFELDAENAEAVGQICRRLDGLPLALELAAARVKLLPVQTLLARLDRRLGLLTTGARDLPERQRTCRNAIAWSFDLLGPHEQAFLTRLAVFAGGFDLEAADAAFEPEDVRAANPEETDALAALAALVDSSLIRQEERHGPPRFTLLETIREYALERLHESGRAGEALDRHATHYVSLAQSAEPALSGPGLVAWLDRLELEHDNLRAALSHLLDHHELDSAVHLVGGVWRFWWLRGHLDEAVQWTERILADREFLSPRPLATALLGAAAMALGKRDFDTAERLAEESLPLLGAAGNPEGQIVLTAILGRTATAKGDLARGRELLEAGLALSREMGDDWGTAMQLNFLGQIPLGESDHRPATELFAEALATSRRLGDRFLILVSLYNLGLNQYAHGDPAEAAALLEEGLRLATEAGDDPTTAHYLEALATLAGHDAPERAACLYGAAEALTQSAGSAWLLATAAKPPEPSVESRASMTTSVLAAARARGRALARGRTIGFGSPGLPADRG